MYIGMHVCMYVRMVTITRMRTQVNNEGPASRRNRTDNRYVSRNMTLVHLTEAELGRTVSHGQAVMELLIQVAGGPDGETQK
jgi:hypothetical protein